MMLRDLLLGGCWGLWGTARGKRALQPRKRLCFAARPPCGCLHGFWGSRREAADDTGAGEQPGLCRCSEMSADGKCRALNRAVITPRRRLVSRSVPMQGCERGGHKAVFASSLRSKRGMFSSFFNNSFLSCL